MIEILLQDEDNLESSATAKIEVKIRGEDDEACVAASVGDFLSGTSVKSDSTISATSEMQSSPPSLGSVSGSGTLEKQKKKKSRKSFRKSFRESFRKRKVAHKNSQEGEGLDD